MRLYELVIENPETDEVFQISLVDNPAIEAFGVFFNKEEVHFAEMGEEGLFMAPILIPDRKILRVDGKGVPYEVYFSSPTIKKLAQMYLERKYQSNVNVEHKEKVDGVTLVESWIKESNTADKSKLYGLNVPVGSWVGTFKIDNEEIREKFRKGELRAVSIEGLFEHLEKTNKDRLQSAMLMESFANFQNMSSEKASVILKKIKEIITEYKLSEPTLTSTYPGEVRKEDEKLQTEGNLDVLGYETKNFEICPGALALFTHLLTMEQEDDTVGMVRSAAVVADTIFRIEKEVISAGTATSSQLSEVQILVKDFKDIIGELNEEFGMVHDVSFMDGHIEVVKSYVGK